MAKDYRLLFIFLIFTSHALYQDIIHPSHQNADYVEALGNIKIESSSLVVDHIQSYLESRPYTLTRLFTQARIMHVHTPEHRVLAIGGDAEIIALQTRRSFESDDYALTIWNIANKTVKTFFQKLPLQELLIHPHQHEFLMINKNILTIYEEHGNQWQPKLNRLNTRNPSLTHVLYTPDGKNIITLAEIYQPQEPQGAFRQLFGKYFQKDFRFHRLIGFNVNEPERIVAATCTEDNQHLIVSRRNSSVSVHDLETFATQAHMPLNDASLIHDIHCSPANIQDIIAYGAHAHFLQWNPETRTLTAHGSEPLAVGTKMTFLEDPRTVTKSEELLTVFDLKHRILVQQDSPTSKKFSLINFRDHDELKKITEEQAIFIMYLQEIKKAFEARHAQRTQTDPSYRYAHALPLTPHVIAQTQFFNSPEKQHALVGYINQIFSSLTPYTQHRIKELLDFMP